MVGGTEYNRFVATPTMWIAVNQGYMSDQHSAIAEPVDYHGVGVVDVETCEGATALLHEYAIAIHRHEHASAILHASEIVILAMAGSRVHGAGARGKVNVITEYDYPRGIREYGAAVLHAQHICALDPHGFAIRTSQERERRLPTGYFSNLLGKRLSHDEAFAVTEDHHIIRLGVQGDGGVRGQRPGGGGPDDHLQRNTGRFECGGSIHHVELHIDGRRGLIAILYLGFRESGMTVHAPVDGFTAAVDGTALIEFLEHLDVARLIFGKEGEVGVIPVSTHAKTLEAITLDIHETLGPFAAQTPQGYLVYSLHLGRTELLLNHVLYWLTVTVPARGIRGVIAHLALGLHDEVLEYLIERVTYVDGTIGIGRTIVKHEWLIVLVLLENLLIEVHVLPLLQTKRLALGKSRAHGEIRLREIHRTLVIVCHVPIPFHGMRRSRAHLYSRYRTGDAGTTARARTFAICNVDAQATALIGTNKRL